MELKDILSKCPYVLRSNFSNLYNEEHFGISSDSIQVVNISGSTFTLEISYADRKLYWEVVFMEDDLTFAPDLYFHDDFLIDPAPNVIDKHLPNLKNWDVNKPTSLILVLKDLIHLYKTHQLDILFDENRYNKYATKVQNMIEDSKHNNFELFVNDGIIDIILSLDIDFSELPQYVHQDMFKQNINPGGDLAVLKMSINVGTEKNTALLQFSPRLEHAVGKSTDLHIPVLKDNVNQFVENTYQLIQDKVNEISRHYKQKIQFIEYILLLHGFGVLECDKISYSKICVLLEKEDMFMIVSISLGARFPLERPIVKLQSVYHEQNDKPKITQVNGFKYNPKCNAKDMYIHLFAKVGEMILKLKEKN